MWGSFISDSFASGFSIATTTNVWLHVNRFCKVYGLLLSIMPSFVTAIWSMSALYSFSLRSLLICFVFLVMCELCFILATQVFTLVSFHNLTNFLTNKSVLFSGCAYSMYVFLSIVFDCSTYTWYMYVKYHV